VDSEPANAGKAWNIIVFHDRVTREGDMNHKGALARRARPDLGARAASCARHGELGELR